MLKVDNLFKIVLNPEASFEQYEDDDDDFLDDEMKIIAIILNTIRF